MKKIYKSSVWLFIGVIFIVFNLGGCASFRKKFIRQKKEKKVAPTYSRIEEYNTVPTIEIYEKHYIFWRSWHREIMELLGENSKKDKRCISEMIGNLQDLRSMLVNEKGDELDKHINRLKEVEKTIIKIINQRGEKNKSMPWPPNPLASIFIPQLKSSEIKNPNPTPPAPPKNPIIIDSAKNILPTSLSAAPIAFITPISLVLSRSVTVIVFAIPIAATSKATNPNAAKTI